MKNSSSSNKLTRHLLSSLCCFILCAGTSGLSRAESVEMNLPPGDYAKQLGTRSIADPSGATHTKEMVAGKVVVAIFSASNMSQGGRQGPFPTCAKAAVGKLESARAS